MIDLYSMVRFGLLRKFLFLYTRYLNTKQKIRLRSL